MWLLCVQYACLAYGWWFYVTWLPTYLRNSRGTSVKMSALLAGLPLLMGGVGCLISAALIPRIASSIGSVARARRIVAIIGFLGASASILIFTRIQDPTLAMVVLGFAGLFNDFVMPAAWAGCMDVGGRYAGTRRGQHEHDGQHRWRALAAGRRLPAGLDEPELDVDLLRLGRDLQHRRGLLDSSSTRTRRWKRKNIHVLRATCYVPRAMPAMCYDTRR